MLVLAGGPAATDPEYDVALGPALLREGRDGADEFLRIYSPAPTAAFSRRDTLKPGYERAAAAARRCGFAPVVRPQGGSMAAYHRGSVVIDHVRRVPDASLAMAERFREFAAVHAAVLTGLGVDARIGAVPGEYCPGEYSINAGGIHKIVGSAQRITRDGWLFSTVIQVGGADRLREVLTAAYGELGYDFDPHSVGAIEDTAASVTVEAVTEAMMDAYGAAGPVCPLLPLW
jgi:octanoyl-[GcvH]:protein N-octanoyltransferase